MSRKHEIDILLINPGDRLQTYQDLGKSLSALEPPVWAGLMATFIRRHGLRAAILDANAEGLTPQQTAQRVSELNPLATAIVVYGHNPSASTQIMPSAGAIATAIKVNNPESLLIMLGGHVAALPEQTLREENVDFTAKGEGLYTLVDLANAFKETKKPDLSKVRDLLYWEDGQVLHSNPAPLVKDLDNLMEGVAWDLLPMELYRAHNWHCFDGLERQPYGSIYTTLGCPFTCTFCCIQAPFKSGENVIGMKEQTNSYRMWSPESIFKQLDVLVNNYGVKNLKFADEMFVLNQRHVLAICDYIIDKGYDLNIWAYARVDTVKGKMLDKLKRAGFNWLAFGIEAADESVRQDVQKGYQEDDIVKTIRMVQDAGIYIGANYIFGLPEDNMDTMQKTLDLAIDINAEYANFYCTMAYPGSELYQKALQNGWRLPDSWGGYSQHAVDSLPLATRYLSGQDVLRFRDNAFHKYFSSTKYLSFIEKTFSRQTRKHVEKMASKRLKRDYSSHNATVAA